MLKPTLLLDVDGVLNVPPTSKADKEEREIRLEWSDKKFVNFWPTELTLPFMKMAWDLFEVRWLTAWGYSANVIARHYGLRIRPAIKYRQYKAVGAIQALQDRRHRKVAWIEDGVDAVARTALYWR